MINRLGKISVGVKGHLISPLKGLIFSSIGMYRKIYFVLNICSLDLCHILFLFCLIYFIFKHISLYINAWFGSTTIQIQEYTEEFREIAGGKAKSRQKDGNIADGNITLVNQRSINNDLPVRVYSFYIRFKFNLLYKRFCSVKSGALPFRCNTIKIYNIANTMLSF